MDSDDRARIELETVIESRHLLRVSNSDEFSQYACAAIILPTHKLLRHDRTELRGRALCVIAYGGREEAAPALLAGADDFLRVPWAPEELLLRLERLLPIDSVFVHGRRIRFRRDAIETSTGRVRLTHGERMLLQTLAFYQGEPVPREILELRAFGEPRPGSRILDVRVSQLRAKLDALLPSGGHSAIEAVRNQGYRLL